MTTPYRVYIAAASVPSEIARVEYWAAKLAEIGVEVVLTWPAQIKAVGIANPRDAHRNDRREWANTCADQVAMSNVLWLLCPPEGVTTRGAWFEFGVAHTCGTDVVCSGDTTQTIFTALADYEVDTDDFAFTVIKAWGDAWTERQKLIEGKALKALAKLNKRTKAVRK